MDTGNIFTIARLHPNKTQTLSQPSPQQSKMHLYTHTCDNCNIRFSNYTQHSPSTYCSSCTHVIYAKQADLLASSKNRKKAVVVNGNRANQSKAVTEGDITTFLTSKPDDKVKAREVTFAANGEV